MGEPCLIQTTSRRLSSSRRKREHGKTDDIETAHRHPRRPLADNSRHILAQHEAKRIGAWVRPEMAKGKQGLSCGAPAMPMSRLRRRPKAFDCGDGSRSSHSAPRRHVPVLGPVQLAGDGKAMSRQEDATGTSVVRGIGTYRRQDSTAPARSWQATAASEPGGYAQLSSTLFCRPHMLQRADFFLP
jgi:hypothetical protein